MMEGYLKALLTGLGAINLFTFLLYGWDKLNAQSGSFRVSEKTMWFFTLIGGSVGALAGMQFFRHKTQKESFKLVVALIVLAHAALVFLFFRSSLS